MTLGRTPVQGDVFWSSTMLVGGRVDPTSLYGILFREGDRLFPDDMFGDLFTTRGRACVPPRIIATVMVLQRAEGLSDRDAVERFEFDSRWKYACGGLDLNYPGFVHTVLVDMRARLRASDDPDRVFKVVLDVARSAGLVGRRRVLDSTALYDAVATMDTVTLVRSAIRGVLAVVDDATGVRLRAGLCRDDDYVAPGKPVCAWDDRGAREQLIDELTRDALSVLAGLDGQDLGWEARRAADLLATVAGQDVEEDAGVFKIVRRVAPDRVISTVDPQTRHGHKTSSRRFDGYKAHIALDPDSEIITATAVTPGNTGDAVPALGLVADVMPPDGQSAEDGVAVYGDASYGAGPVLAVLHEAEVDVKCKVQPPVNRDGLYPKDQFNVDLDAGRVTCPAGHSVKIRWNKEGGGGVAGFGVACRICPLRAACTTASNGRKVHIDRYEADLQKERQRQLDPTWKADYQATRPKVERHFQHLTRHGNRRARVRGQTRVAADFTMLAAALNLARLAILGVYYQPQQGWTAG